MDATEQHQLQNQEPSADTDKLSYEIFSILESKFLFGYDEENRQLWIPRPSPLWQHPEPEGKVCVLSIDGGAGMRGILPGRALAYLEQFLKNKSGDPEACISDFFDVAAGTGVGGVFALMLFATRDGTSPIFCADDTWRLLADKGNRFFVHRKGGRGVSRRRLLRGAFCRGGEGSGVKIVKESRMTAATAGVEQAMKEAFGEELTLRDTVKPVLIPCYDLRSGAPFLFSRADALEADGFDFRLWEVCRATWAEPGRFEPVDMRSVDGSTRCVGVDGGLAMSNPAAAAITHVLHNKQEFPFVRGVEDLYYWGGGVSVRQQEWNGYEQVKRWKAREWARPVARIASDGSADLVDHSVALAFGQSQSSNYVRIQANTSGSSSFHPDVDSDAGAGNVKMLLGVAEEMLKQRNVESQTNLEKLEWFAGELVLEHRRRNSRIAPTVAFKQAAPKRRILPPRPIPRGSGLI
ncbi:unnamed protein product [Spirodela intermedia]|uniref:Patatin n=1 Tax=Spirodela intermedia TaxID=51605 RepID=A0A7I8IBS3_SPIIN|nr:unnamed protein product [Spirodela intermedia]CAA6655236.1 unnamed protein product [Spirodela intermedia]